MMSRKYIFKSNTLKDSYINGTIDHQSYLSSLEGIKKEELASVVFDFKQREMEEAICQFENQQVQEAKQDIEQRLKQAQLEAEAERTRQLEAIRAIEEKEKQVQPKTLEETLLEARKEFFEKESINFISSYKSDAKKHRSRHDRMQLAVIAGSALATSTTAATIFTNGTNLSVVLKITAAIFSLVVTISSGAMAYFKYKERSNDTQKAADAIEDEHSAVKLGTGPYRGRTLEDSLSLFAENTLNIISDHKKKQQLLDQPPDAKPKQDEK